MATVELETLTASNVVESVTLRVYGGQDHREQETAAGRYLDAMAEFTAPIVCNVYERTPKTDSKGTAYVEFRFFTWTTRSTNN
jgi:hypothetical protein